MIYGFSSVAPLGPMAAATLSRYFRAAGDARDRPGPRRAAACSATSRRIAMAVTQGMTDTDPQADVRARRVPVRRRPPVRRDEARLRPRAAAAARSAKPGCYLDRIQRLTTALDEPARRTPAVAAGARGHRARRRRARSAFSTSRATPTSPRCARACSSWRTTWAGCRPTNAGTSSRGCSASCWRAARVGVAEVDLACTLNQEHDLDGAFNRRVRARQPGRRRAARRGSRLPGQRRGARAHAARRWSARTRPTCGSRRPTCGTGRSPTTPSCAASPQTSPAWTPSDAQVRALEALARHYVSDRECSTC